MQEKRWGISIDQKERMELERVVLDHDEASALKFLEECIYPRVAEWDKDSYGCLHVALDSQEAEIIVEEGEGNGIDKVDQ